MSLRLHERCALAILVSGLLASLMGLLAWGPIVITSLPQADGATQVGTSTRAGLDFVVLAHLLPLAGAACGWFGARRTGWPLQSAWQVFFAAAAAATVAAAVQHLSPTATGSLVGHLLGSVACAVLALIFVAERLGCQWVARPALGVAVGVALLGAVVGAVLGDLRLLVWCQALPLLMLPMAIWGLPSAGLTGRDWLIALMAFAMAQATALLTPALVDGSVSSSLHRALLQQAGIALALAWLALALWRRRAAAQPRAGAVARADSVRAS